MRSDSPELLTRTQQARRDDIVRAAIAILNADGYAEASVDRIARAAGTTKSTVLYHFATKDAIYQEIVASLYRLGTAYMTERIVAAATWRDRLAAYVESNLRFIAENAAHVTAVHRITENSGHQTDWPDAIDPLAGMLSSGQATGEFGEFDPQTLALMVRAVVDAASFYFTAHPELDVDHHIAEAVALFDRAAAPAAPSRKDSK